MKATIDALLEQLEAHPQPASVQAAIEPVQAALESGALDCLVEHHASQPPDADQNVLAMRRDAIHPVVAYIHSGDGLWTSSETGGVLHGVVETWQELPLKVKK